MTPGSNPGAPTNIKPLIIGWFLFLWLQLLTLTFNKICYIFSPENRFLNIQQKGKEKKMKIATKATLSDGRVMTNFQPSFMSYSAVCLGRIAKAKEVRQNGSGMFPDDDLIMPVGEGQNKRVEIVLNVTVSDADAWSLMVSYDGRGKQVKAVDPNGSVGQTKTFQRTVTAFLKGAGYFFASGAGNFRIAVLTQRNQLQYHHVGLVIQNNVVFLVHHHMANSRLFVENGKVLRKGTLCVRELSALCRVPSFRGISKSFPDISEAKSRGEYTGKAISKSIEGEGTVDWFDQIDRQTGVVHLWYDGELVPAKVHFRDCPEQEHGRRFLARGQIIKASFMECFDEETTWDPTDPVHKKPVVYFAKGVTLVHEVAVGEPEQGFSLGGQAFDALEEFSPSKG